MCDCHSYNKDSGTVKEIILNTKDFFDHKEKTICVDACISDQIIALWSEGIWTLGSCCGHNKDVPNVIIAESASPELAHKVLKIWDDREWKVLQWKLIEV